jgi:hypothetical protein
MNSSAKLEIAVINWAADKGILEKQYPFGSEKKDWRKWRNC